MLEAEFQFSDSGKGDLRSIKLKPSLNSSSFSGSSCHQKKQISVAKSVHGKSTARSTVHSAEKKPRVLANSKLKYAELESANDSSDFEAEEWEDLNRYLETIYGFRQLLKIASTESNQEKILKFIEKSKQDEDEKFLANL